VNKIKPTIYRFWPELRSSHLEMLGEVASSTFLYMKTKSDFDASVINAGSKTIKQSFASTLWQILRDKPNIIEVPEPLFLRYLPHTSILIAFVSVVRVASSWKPKFITYCIDNSDIHARPEALKWVSSSVWIAALSPLVRFVASRIDKVAFGSPASKDSLLDWLSPRQRSKLLSGSKVFLALPRPCSCNLDIPKNPKQILFLAALETRKGFVELMEAWAIVEAKDQHATLILIGSGELSGLASEFSSRLPRVNFMGSQGRAEVHRVLRQSGIVVLPSLSAGRWREQLGLSIVEGIAHGCRIVTSRDTALADFLEKENQQVISRYFSVEELAAGILESLDSKYVVNINSLPTQNQRVAADIWLTSD
jgi:glycosyltransferase involved in cell wall biosynthesis